MKTRVLIADDHSVVRAGLRLLINGEPALELVGEASGGIEAINLTRELNPEIVILDISLPDIDGIQVTREIHSIFPQMRILILTVHEDETILREVIHAGASGYILKQAAETEMMAAIRIVQKGEIYVHSSMIRALIVQESPDSKSDITLEEALTPREKEILSFIVQGFTNKEIAETLGISKRTVDGHRANLTSKLNISRRVDLIRYARSQGVI